MIIWVGETTLTVLMGYNGLGIGRQMSAAQVIYGDKTMALKQAIRQFRRWSAACVVWAMIPLTIASGAPAASCACTDCRCGAVCPLNRSIDTGQASGACSTEAPVSSQNCCGCCKLAAAAGQDQSPSRSNAPGFSGPQSRCRSLIAVRSAVSPIATPSCDQQVPALGELPVQLLGPGFQATHRPEQLDTGPPIDLTLKFCHFVI